MEVIFMHQSLYPWQDSLQYPLLDRRLERSQNQSGDNGKEKDPCLCQKSNSGYMPHRLVTALTELN
jgi:hypothetical protein